MDEKHELAFDLVLRGSEAFGVLYYQIAMSVGVDEVGDIAAGALEEFPGTVALRGDYLEWYLLAQSGDYAGTLHQLELVGAVVLFFRGMSANLDSMILARAGAVGTAYNLIGMLAQLVNCQSLGHCRYLRILRG